MFDSLSEVDKEYVEVAELIPPPGGAEYMPDPKNVVRAQRKKAAKLGANGLVVQHGHRQKNVYYREDGAYDIAIAIFIPEDSAHAANACNLQRGR